MRGGRQRATREDGRVGVAPEGLKRRGRRERSDRCDAHPTGLAGSAAHTAVSAPVIKTPAQRADHQSGSMYLCGALRGAPAEVGAKRPKGALAREEASSLKILLSKFTVLITVLIWISRTVKLAKSLKNMVDTLGFEPRTR